MSDTENSKNNNTLKPTIATSNPFQDAIDIQRKLLKQQLEDLLEYPRQVVGTKRHEELIALSTSLRDLSCALVEKSQRVRVLRSEKPANLRLAPQQETHTPEQHAPAFKQQSALES